MAVRCRLRWRIKCFCSISPLGRVVGAVLPTARHRCPFSSRNGAATLSSPFYFRLLCYSTIQAGTVRSTYRNYTIYISHLVSSAPRRLPRCTGFPWNISQKKIVYFKRILNFPTFLFFLCFFPLVSVKYYFSLAVFLFFFKVDYFFKGFGPK